MHLDFYKGKRVLITGHTGFKGAWLCRMLMMLHADVTGFALAPASPSLYSLCMAESPVHSFIGDIRDLTALRSVMDCTQPEIVIHMAAQPIVRTSYEKPVYTFETNVMGTVNLLEAVRQCPSVRSVVNVTTDKVYRNREWAWGYRETDELCGFDPYSNSKSCSELVTDSYRNSFLAAHGVAVSTCRAGNVIGGGDFAQFRIIPDCAAAAAKNAPILVRNPNSVRPYQFVLEPLAAYLTVAQRQFENPALSGCYNIGPEEADCLTTGELVSLFCSEWNAAFGTAITWQASEKEGPHEAGLLKLDCAKMKTVFGWHPTYNIKEAVKQSALWYGTYAQGKDITAYTDDQIAAFFHKIGCEP